MDIMYLKLINGDELFAKCVGEEDGYVLLDDVMVMETIATADDATKYLFMSRYSPYGMDSSMPIARSMIIFMTEVTNVVRGHYENSLQYSLEISDERFAKGIGEASDYLGKILEKNRNKKMDVKEQSVEDVREKFLGGFHSDTQTKH